MTHLLTIASWECDGESWRRWVPVEEYPLDRRRDPKPGDAMAHLHDAELMLGDAGSMFLLTCEVCAHRPVVAVTQMS
jgi:hypothetical protein